MQDELFISRELLDEVISFCKEAYPNEACGILAGKGNEVLKIYKMANIENSPVSYLTDSGEQFKVIKDMRENNLSMVAIFHSHPSSAAYPSLRDVNLAFYHDSAYVIVGLTEKEPAVKAFSIGEGDIKEIEVVVKSNPES